MGFLKSSANEMVSCDNVVSVATDDENDNLIVWVTYATSLGADVTTNNELYVLRASITYLSGTNNEMELTLAEYQKIFADAIASMSGASGPAVSLPIVNNKVTATGEVIGAVTPSIVLDYDSIGI